MADNTQAGTANSIQAVTDGNFEAEVLTASSAQPVMVDFWAEPLYVDLLLDMQKRIHDYVVADQGTAKEALDLLVKDWTKVFKDEGKKVDTAAATE